ncbi:GNAT family N-acetyltransferase [Anaerosacchariphilus polymeriproducens]|uniref:GNAT family N-acetyltransferase n=1 Tax=Anaerosacchariphilus polymeriproducens TaxID=1812858 RepID=A0A371AYF4_9FIRM|nr:GNAT family N-acetyltransferase [Anaerosacchariphilus polymeriproducens]RDU24596.1 GNAT family N-acetyltransferase [Anaerosacchariphilus polymeriproducens]
MIDKFEVVKGYRHNGTLRKSFNELAKKIFGINFEDWYKNGYWTDKYNPYSIIVENKVVSNVSVNIMEFVANEKSTKYLQLGTVMTAEKYRNNGFISRIMEEIEKDYNNIVEGMYLFANDSVLEFYPKFGYRKTTEYQYSKVICSKCNEVKLKKDNQAQNIQMNNMKDWLLLEKAIEDSVKNCGFEMKNNKELIMFYITQFMQNNVYYIESEGAYVIAEINGDELFLHNIFSEKVVNIDTIANSFSEYIKKVVFGFVPLNNQGYKVEKLCKENTTLLLKGKGFDLFEQDKCIFPTLSHA